ncbi:MAG TPA: hypothetical protein VFK78_02905 [Gemmatimonadales bacterium]|nr:hypothetical protein [Gemmatimonadales bacterium]
MRTKLLLVAAAVAGSALVCGTRSAQASRAATAAQGRAVAPEPHPEIRAAIDALERARLHLKSAAHDFGGHRVAAIAAIDRALIQLRLALQYDRD